MLKGPLILVLALAAGALASGCAAGGSAGDAHTAAPLHGVYVGRLAGTRAFVAIGVAHGRARAYLCDSHRTAAWFRAPIRDGRIDSRSDRLRLRARLNASQASGTVTLADRASHTFRLSIARKPAGLYEAHKTRHGVRSVADWILLADGEQRGGMRNIGLDPDAVTSVQPAPRLVVAPESFNNASEPIKFIDFPANVG